MRTWFIALTLLSSSFTLAQDDPRKQVVVEKGKKAPDFVALDVKGKQFKLSQFMKKRDKNVVLIFSRGAF